MIQNKSTADLFQKYFDKTATAKERKELMILITKMESDEELLDLMEDAFQTYVPDSQPFVFSKGEILLQQIQAGIDKAEKEVPASKLTHKIGWLRYAVAASVVLVMGLCGYYYFASQHKSHSQFVQNDFSPGGNNAVLTLSNGKTIILNNARNGTLANQDGIVVNKTHEGEIIYDASKMGQEDDHGAPAYNNISTPKGGQYQVVLSDGTKVWLNSVSSISFPTAFGSKERQVKITGEVYFEVAKDKTKPFLVRSGNQLIEVLGTHFNVNSYTDEPDIKTTLLEGSVQIKQLNNGYSALLKPGQQAVNNAAGPILVKPADLEQAVAWKYGFFQLKDASIETIMRQASRWYDVDVEYQGKIPQRKFSGKIKRDVKASEFLQMLTYFNVHFTMEGRKIIVKN